MREHKKIANYLPTGAVLFFAIIALAFVLMPTPKKKFKLSQEETHATIINHIQVIQPEKVKDIMEAHDQGYQFIDLRSPQEFNLHHLPGAINIPIHDILNNEFEALLNPTDKINILYGSTVEDTCPTWIILKQLDYKNNSIMLGGYKLIKSNVIDKYAPEDVWFKDEVAKYDYAEIVKETAGAGSALSSSSAPKKTSPIKRKKKKAVAGGC
jgi:rhodanese-related sulfurtransferase